MASSNGENTQWNTSHEGNRVPFPTSALGYPSALFAAGSWSSGAINTAVIETFLIQGGTEEELQDRGFIGRALPLNQLEYLVNRDHLYGDAGEGRGQFPASTGAYRAYPTPIIENQTLELVENSSNYPWTVEGIPDTNAVLSDYAILAYKVQLTNKLPYALEFTLDLTDNSGQSIETGYAIRIEAGSLEITHVSMTLSNTTDPEDIPTTGWIKVPSGEAFLSVLVGVYTEDITVTVTPGNVIQAPYYGTLDPLNLLLPSSSFGVPSTNPSLYPVWHTEFMRSPECYTTNCPEIDEPYLTSLGGLRPYTVGTLQIGSILLDSVDDQPVIDAALTAAGYTYYISDVDGTPTEIIKTILTYLRTDYKGEVVFLENPPTTYHGPGCWLESGCA